MKNDEFVVSYSGGKDAALAFYHAVKSGMTPLAAFTAFDRESGHSWFHRFPEALLKRVGPSLGIPLEIVDTQDDRYAEDFETALIAFKSRGARSVVFGDIDIAQHREWCDRRCENAGLTAVFPLWGHDRRRLVDELIDLGFRAIITTVDTTKMNENHLGKTLSKEIVSQIAAEGADPCGENGEYHTFVYDGPLFREKIEFETDKPEKAGDRIHLPLR